MYRTYRPRCLLDIQPHHHCETATHQAMYKWPLDNAELCRLPDGRRFLISHTYCDDHLCGPCLQTISKWQKTLPALRWTTAGKDRSWYFPSQRNLLVLAPQDVLNDLCLSYPVPDVHKPVGCVTYKTLL